MGNPKKSGINALLTPDETSAILGNSTGTLTVWRSTGRCNLPFVKVGGRVMYNPDDIQAFIKDRTRTQTS